MLIGMCAGHLEPRIRAYFTNARGACATDTREPGGGPRARGQTPCRILYIHSHEALNPHNPVMKAIRTALIWAALTCASGCVVPALAKTAAVAATPPTETLAACSWDRPGHNPFMGDVVAAVDRYRDIAPDVRARLKARMARRDYDDLVSIRRDSITGRAKYGSTISDMHFGTHQVCRSVTRASWSPAMQERGLVYCDSGQCILVPTVCRNVSRIARAGVSNERAEGPPEDPTAVAGGAVSPEEAFWAEPADAAASTPLALDSAPSFAAPDDRPGLLFGGGAGTPGGFWPGSDGPGLLPGTGPTVTTTSVPPFGSDSPGPVIATAPPPPFGTDAPPPGAALTPVPEPQSWALMLGGLAALAVVARRRRRVVKSC